MVGIARADLFTTNKYLETIMLEQYPGRMYENQIKKDTTDPQKKIYSFYDLDLFVLSSFLDKCPMFQYEIRNSETGQYLIVNDQKTETRVLFL